MNTGIRETTGILYKGNKIFMSGGNKHGNYPAVYIDGRIVGVHILVWEEHYGKVPDGYIVHHKDENKNNYLIENLELLSKAEHMRKHQKLGTYKRGKQNKTERPKVKTNFPNNHKLTKEQVDYIRKVYKKYDREHNATALANKFNVSKQAIFDVVNYNTWNC